MRSIFRINVKCNLLLYVINHSSLYWYITKGHFMSLQQLTSSFWMLSSVLQLHLFTYHWGVSTICVYVCVSVYVLWIFQRAHLVAMCQCHWPLCSPSGWYTHLASSDSCSIRGPSRTTGAQTYPCHTHRKHEANSKYQCAYCHKPTHTYNHMRNVHTERENGFYYFHKLCIF